MSHLFDHGGRDSSDAFSDSAFSALNISTTTSTVMNTVLAYMNEASSYLFDQGGRESRDAFSDSALSALNISTTTSTVMDTVLGARDSNG